MHKGAMALPKQFVFLAIVRSHAHSRSLPKQLVFLAIIGVITCLIVMYRRQIAEWLIGNLRGGGPRPPSHPLPGNDGFLVLRRKHRPEPSETDGV
jgi:hypothetical protein